MEHIAFNVSLDAMSDCSFPTFEVNIRVLGGLLSSYLLSEMFHQNLFGVRC